MRAVLSTMFLLAACADLGPFRASDSDELSDAGATGDVDAPPTVMPDASTTPMGATKVADAPNEPHGLAVTDDYVYWAASDRKLRRAMKTSSGSVQSLDIVDHASALAADGHDVYWLAGDDVRKTTDASFTLASPLHTNVDLAGVLALSTDYVYVAERGIGVGNDELHRVPRAGGSAELVRSGIQVPSWLSIDGTTMYVIAGTEVHAAPLSSPSSTTTLDTGFMRLLASGGGRACWVKQPDINLPAVELWCTQANGKVRVATSPQQFLAVAVTPTHVFYSSQLGTGASELRKHSFAANTSAVVVAATPGIHVSAIAVDATNLYWLTTNDVSGHVWRTSL